MCTSWLAGWEEISADAKNWWAVLENDPKDTFHDGWHTLSHFTTKNKDFILF